MFISDKFIFDNIPSTTYNIYLVSFENDIIKDMKIPYTNSITKQTSNKYNPFYKEEYEKPEEITLTLAYMDNESGLLPFTDETFIRLKKWLITDYFAPFIVEEYPQYKFYLKCVKIQDKLSFNNTGFLEVTFQPYTFYAYKVFETTILSNGENISDVLNEANDTYYPILHIINTGEDNSTIKINNLEIYNIKQNEEIIVDNSLLTIFNSEGENKIKDCNRKWLGLSKGNNPIVVNGTCRVTIKAEFPVIL